MFLNVDNAGAKQMSSGRLFQATGPATEYAQLLSCSLVLGTTKSPRAAKQIEWRGEFSLHTRTRTVVSTLGGVIYDGTIHPEKKVKRGIFRSTRVMPAMVCRLMVTTLVIHVITWIITHLPTPEGWKAEFA